MELAHLELGEVREAQKRNCDRGGRQLSVGDRALILLPTSHNKLLILWKSHFTVIENKNEVDYKIYLGRTCKVFHINMLKRYGERASHCCGALNKWVLL